MVTHDTEEAMFMSGRIIVLKDGHMVQQGRPIDLYCRPQSAFVAEFFGEQTDPAIGHNGQVESLFGSLDCDTVEEGEEAVVLRHEGLQVSMETASQRLMGLKPLFRKHICWAAARCCIYRCRNR